MTLIASLACVMHESHSDHHRKNNSMDILNILQKSSPGTQCREKHKRQ